MKKLPTLLMLLCVPFAATLVAKTGPVAGATKPSSGKVDEIEADSAVVTAKKLYDEACKELKDAEAAKAPSDKIKELIKAKESAMKDLKEARQEARKRIAEKKAEAEKAKRSGKK